MEQSVQYPRGRQIVAAIALLCTFAAAEPANTSPSGLSLDGILLRLQIRRWQYDRNVPDFFAEEIVTSELRGSRIAPIHTVTESIFRLRRNTNLGVYPPGLVETRTVRRSNGVAVAGDSPIAGPTILVNAFSTGLNTITLSQKACYDFTLARHRDVHHTPVFAIDYRMKPGAEHTGACAPWGNASGQALVDAHTMNVLHFDMHIPHYPITTTLMGSWRWSIDYAPVLLDGATFSLPRHIDSISTSEDGGLVWTFSAIYRNYHKTGVHSRIITATGDDNASPQ